MATINWGLLNKSQVDSQTIEQVIDAKIAAHEADPASHLGVGESLQSHKASEIIDHVAESIVTDKIRSFDVTDDKFAFDRLTIESDFSSILADVVYCSGSGVLTNYTGLVYLSTGATIGSIASLRNETASEEFGVDMLQDPIFFCIAKLSSFDDLTAYWGVEPSNEGYFRFFVTGGHLHCESGWLGTVDDTDLGLTVDVTEFHKYRVVYNTGESVKFYIDDLLVATHTSNLPENSPDYANQLGWWRLQVQNSISAEKILFVRYINYCQNI